MWWWHFIDSQLSCDSFDCHSFSWSSPPPSSSSCLLLFSSSVLSVFSSPFFLSFVFFSSFFAWYQFWGCIWSTFLFFQQFGELITQDLFYSCCHYIGKTVFLTWMIRNAKFPWHFSLMWIYCLGLVRMMGQIDWQAWQTLQPVYSLARQKCWEAWEILEHGESRALQHWLPEGHRIGKKKWWAFHPLRFLNNLCLPLPA